MHSASGTKGRERASDTRGGAQAALRGRKSGAGASRRSVGAAGQEDRLRRRRARRERLGGCLRGGRCGVARQGGDAAGGAGAAFRVRGVVAHRIAARSVRRRRVAQVRGVRRGGNGSVVGVRIRIRMMRVRFMRGRADSLRRRAADRCRAGVAMQTRRQGEESCQRDVKRRSHGLKSTQPTRRRRARAASRGTQRARHRWSCSRCARSPPGRPSTHSRGATT